MTESLQTQAGADFSAPPQRGAEEYFERPKGKLALWTGVLGGPVAWAVQMQTGYALTYFSCPHPRLAAVHHAVTLLLLGAAIACTALAWRDWRRIGVGEPQGVEGGVPGRSRFLATLGILTSGLFSLVIFSQWLPMFFLSPCFY